MYHSVTFGDKNSWDDWHLIPISRPVINPPPVDTKYIEIPGLDYPYDMTEWLTGYPRLKNRTGSIEFAVENDFKQWSDAYSTISNYLHGQKMRLILEDDPDFYYEGRMFVNKWKSDKWYSIISIDYNLSPWKKYIHSTSEPWLWDSFNFFTGVIREKRNISINGLTIVTVIGNRKPESPTIEASAAMALTFKNKSYNIVAGRNTFSDIILSEGPNELKFNGNGTVTIDYVGGSL